MHFGGKKSAAKFVFVDGRQPNVKVLRVVHAEVEKGGGRGEEEGVGVATPPTIPKPKFRRRRASKILSRLLLLLLSSFEAAVVKLTRTCLENKIAPVPPSFL